MSRTSPDRRFLALAAIVAAGLVLAAGACTDVSVRSEARAEISGPDDTPVRLVTSTEFVRSGGSTSDPTAPDTTGIQVSLITADTSERRMPATVSQSLTESQRFYIQAVVTDSATLAERDSVEAQMQLFVDGDRRGSVRGDLLEGPLEITFTSFVSG